MIKKIAAGLAVAIIAVLAYAYTRPDTFRVARTVSIDAPPAFVLPLVADVKAQTGWSPFEKDPQVKKTFSEQTRGVGASYEWDGNSEMGAGKLVISEATERRIVMDLHFRRPLEAHNVAAFELEPKGETTEVTWSIAGPMPFISKLMDVFFDIDKMVGAEFDRGLSRLKTIAEDDKKSKK